jgi:hypothetical protein
VLRLSRGLTLENVDKTSPQLETDRKENAVLTKGYL